MKIKTYLLLVAVSLMPLTKVDAQIDTLKLLTDAYNYLEDTNDKNKIAEVESFLIKRKEFYYHQQQRQKQQQLDSIYLESIYNLILFYKQIDNREALCREIKIYVDFDKYDDEIKKRDAHSCWGGTFVGRLRARKWLNLPFLIQYHISRRNLEMATYYMNMVTGIYHCAPWCGSGTSPTEPYRDYLEKKELEKREISFDSLLIYTFSYCNKKQGFLYEDVNNMVINYIKKYDKVKLVREQKKNLCIVKTKEDKNNQCPIFYVEFCGIELSFSRYFTRKKYANELEKSGLQTSDESIISLIRAYYENKMKESLLMKELEKL